MTNNLIANDHVGIKANDLTYRDRASIVAPVGWFQDIQQQMYLFLKFAAVPSAVKYKLVASCHLCVYFEDYSSSGGYLEVGSLDKSLSFATASIPTLINSVVNWSAGQAEDFRLYRDRYSRFSLAPSLILEAIRYGIRLSFYNNRSSYYWGRVYTPQNSTNKPYLELVTNDTDYHITASGLSPNGGYIDDSKSSVFTAVTTDNGYCPAQAEFEANTKYTLQWRLNSSSSTSSITSTTGPTITVPANTFPTTGSFQARLMITDANEYTTYSSFVTYSTTDAVSTATPISPVNAIVNKESSISLSWSHDISTGSAQKKAEFQYSKNASSWYSWGTINGDVREGSLSTSSLGSGLVYWRVRTYNSDSAAGSWSDAVSFVLIAPPTTPKVSTDGKPVATISWQTDMQQAFQVKIENVFDSDIRFGSDKTFKLPLILQDGDYTVNVRVQNELGLWSEWGSAPLKVRNVAGPGMQLHITLNDYNAELSWDSVTYPRYVVYRDGVPVAVVNSKNYSDPMVIGFSSWRVVGVMDTGYYDRSNDVSLSLDISGVVIRDFDGGGWVRLERTQSQYAEQTLTSTRNVTYRHFAGAELPVAEMSDSYEKTLSFSAALSSAAEIAALEALQGKRVICKSSSGDLIVGILDKVIKTHGLFFDNFEITVRGTHYEEAVEL